MFSFLSFRSITFLLAYNFHKTENTNYFISMQLLLTSLILYPYAKVLVAIFLGLNTFSNLYLDDRFFLYTKKYNYANVYFDTFRNYKISSWNCVRLPMTFMQISIFEYTQTLWQYNYFIGFFFISRTIKFFHYLYI